MKHIILTICIVGFLACTNSNRTEKKNGKPEAATTVSLNGNGNTADSAFYFPNDTLFMAKVLTTGGFHADEVWARADTETWFGLFWSKEGYYLAQTNITIKRVHDDMLDESGQETGWEVSTANKDTSLLLFSKLDFIAPRKVQSVKLPGNQIYPGDTVTLNYSGKRYTLFASGVKQRNANDTTSIDILNYKLYLTAQKGGSTITELLVAQPTFDDQMTTIIFVGDIDGDGFIDLIIDTSNNYDVTTPTLYLSKPAGDKLLKVVGQHISVGC